MREKKIRSTVYGGVVQKYNHTLQLNELITLLALKSGSNVLEIATGKGEFLILLIEKYNVSAIGVDISPYHLGDAKKKRKSVSRKSI